MRLARLSLAKYGHFQDCDLDFAPGAMDFHLVFGRNEAGKSTTMSAVGDLLFGFPHACAHNFRFHESLLRVGATIQTGTQTLDVKRRRGRKDTLLDATDGKLPEGPLLAALHGMTREKFMREYSLDHARLRQGGREIVDADARDDIGAALFAAGSGVLGAQKLLADLQTEADAIWGERRAGGKSYWQAAKHHEEAKARLAAALVRPRAWLAERDRLAGLERAQAELEDERAAQQAGLDRLQRTRRLAAPVASRAFLLGKIGNPAGPGFDPQHEAAHDQATAAIASAELRRVAAETALAEARRARAAVSPDRALLDRESAITEMVRASGEAAKAALDLPAVLEEMGEIETEARRLTREMGLAAAPLDTLLEGLPPPALLADLQDRANRAPALHTRLDEAREQIRRDEAAHDEALRALARQPPSVDGQVTAAALRQGQAARAVAGRVAERRRAVILAERALADALARLPPWDGASGQLAEIRPPGEPEVKAAEAALAEAEHDHAEAVRASRVAADRIERLELETHQVAKNGRAVSSGDIGDARNRRDALWHGLRAGITARILPAEAAMATYGQAVTAADELADQRFDTAEASARLTNFIGQTALARLDVEQASRRLASATATLAACGQAWRTRLARAGLPDMPPGACRQWAADRLDALQRQAALANARQALLDDEAVIADASARLSAACTPPAPPGMAFADLLDRVQTMTDVHAQAAGRRSAAEAGVKATQAALSAARGRQDERESQVAAWTQDWRAAVARSGLALNADTVPALLPLLGQLRGALEAALRQQRRVAGIRRDEARFEAQVWALAAACGIVGRTLDSYAMVERLRLGLATALQDDRAAREADASVARWQAERDGAQHLIAAAQAQLAPLLARAGAADLAELARAIEAWRQQREARAQVAAVERAILTDGDGYSLEALTAEVAGADLEQLGQAAEAARRAVAALDVRIASTAQAVGQARAAFGMLDHGEDAPLAAADECSARAAMAAEAETYLLKRAQAVMLKWAVDDYRKRQESPLLRRASALFGKLTLGRYERLDIDRSGDKPRLVGHCKDGRSLVGVDGMSDGTADQLFLALRLASLEQSLEAGVVLPFLADDLFINFDDRRAHAGFEVLGEIARRTQVLFFTHHDHLRAIAADALGPHTVPVCELPSVERA